jgi:hypothetical protein
MKDVRKTERPCTVPHAIFLITVLFKLLIPLPGMNSVKYLLNLKSWWYTYSQGKLRSPDFSYQFNSRQDA